jgi:hypothetical protein
MQKSKRNGANSKNAKVRRGSSLDPRRTLEAPYL